MRVTSGTDVTPEIQLGLIKHIIRFLSLHIKTLCALPPTYKKFYVYLCNTCDITHMFIGVLSKKGWI
jgi:hypothetical protein